MPGLNNVSIIDVTDQSEEYLRGLGHLAYTFRYALERDVSQARRILEAIEYRSEEVRQLSKGLLYLATVTEENLKRNEEQVEIFEKYIKQVIVELERQGKEPLDTPL